MGIGSDALEILVQLRQKGYLHGRQSVIEIGAQQLASSFLEAHALIDRLGSLYERESVLFRRDNTAGDIVHGDLPHLETSAPMAKEFWDWLGFEYASIDIDGSPGSIPLDLNYDAAPANARGKYLLVTNFGTTEHVANQLNAFKVIHDLTAHGGIMIHSLPMQGMFNHGLVNYNPKFFWMLGRSNGYKLLDMNVLGSGLDYELPSNIVDMISSFRTDIALRTDRFRTSDSSVVVVFQKTFDTPFVAPLDVPDGMRTANKVLEDRYWSVLRPFAWGESPAPQPRQKLFWRRALHHVMHGRDTCKKIVRRLFRATGLRRRGLAP